MKASIRRRIKRVLIYVPLYCLLASLVAIMVFRFVPVCYTPLMALRSFEYRKDTGYYTRREWKPLIEMGAELPMAVMVAEDIRFIIHKGFDWEAIRQAKEDHAAGKALRGASTISQQTAKNVFLLPHRSWIRKGLEAYFTIGIEWVWGKKRILEVYLNVAEMGPGVFGAEAAAQYYYHKSAKELTAKEAALIASCLPNPKERNPLFPTRSMKNRQEDIERTMSLLPTPMWLLE